MTEAYICDAVRTPIGRYAGALSKVRTDDLATVPIKALMARNPKVDWDKIDDVILGNVNQAGEDNRNVARMVLLLSGLPERVPGHTVNRLCSSGLQAVGSAAQAVKSGEADLMIAGGVEGMSRAPFVIPKSESPFDRNMTIYDSTIGWRFVNPKMQKQFGAEQMGETAENVAREYQLTRAEQDAFAVRSQQKAAAAQKDGRLAEEIVPVTIPGRKGQETVVSVDEHPRGDTTMEILAKLKPAFREDGTVTAGNSSGVNDGACALIIASEKGVKEHGLTPRARILGMAAAGVAPRVMGIGPVPATKKLLARLGLTMNDIDLVELNEAFASQSIAVLRDLGLKEDDARVNPQGGAIALGHPLGCSGARLATTATYQLQRTGGKRALLSLCVGVGQGLSVMIERV